MHTQMYGYVPTRQSPQHLAFLERAAAQAAARAAAAAAARSAAAPPKSTLQVLKDMVLGLLRKFSRSALLKAVSDKIEPPCAATDNTCCCRCACAALLRGFAPV